MTDPTRARQLDELDTVNLCVRERKGMGYDLFFPRSGRMVL